ncbi:MAG: MurR/RpiR family transcriptional regulator [Candidatus Heteroscillospira sp.]
MDGYKRERESEINNQDAVFEIHNRFNTLSKTNKIIARYVLDNPSEIPQLTISGFAKQVNSTPSSITRFCQTLGFAGYPAFKYYVTNNLSAFNVKEKNILPGESVVSVKNKVCDLYLQMIRESVAIVEERLIDMAVNRILQAKRIFLFSQGGSGVSAQFAQTVLMQFGLSCWYYNDVTLSKLAAIELTPHDVAIGISFSGMARVPVDALRIAREKKAYTICITGFSNSYITRYANISLCYNCKIDDDIRTMNIARICEIGILGVLQGCILAKNYDRIEYEAERRKKAHLQGRYSVHNDDIE